MVHWRQRNANGPLESWCTGEHRNWCTRDAAVALLVCVCRFECSTRDAAVITISLLLMSSLVSLSDEPNDEQNATFFRKSEIICPAAVRCRFLRNLGDMSFDMVLGSRCRFSI